MSVAPDAVKGSNNAAMQVQGSASGNIVQNNRIHGTVLAGHYHQP